MQPLAYFAIRAVLGWLQFSERSNRAFLSNPLALVAAGAAHCWAVVYALFVAIHTRAMRYDGYHEGYTEHLPFSVAWTETLAAWSLSIWWIAGFTTAAVRILDDDATDLPMELGDTKSNIITRVIRSPILHSALAVAHTVSCVGLFVSILLLCVTMGGMSGSITVCELCLIVVSAAFAIPHAAIAANRFGGGDLALPMDSAEAAASEAASIGPQLAVILALADTPGHAYLWQNLVYLSVAIVFVASVAASAHTPPKRSGDALPPESLETFTCLALDAAASVCVFLCFPHLNTKLVWVLAVLLTLLAASVKLPEWRDLYCDLLEPLFVVRSDTYKRLPGPTRQVCRSLAWVIGLLCATTAVWDICLHPIQEGLRYGADSSLFNHLVRDQDAVFLFRWQPSLAEAPTNEKMLATAAEHLKVDGAVLDMKKVWPEHRLASFKYTGPELNYTSGSVAVPYIMQWSTEKFEGELAGLVDKQFPPQLKVVVCQSLKALQDHHDTMESDKAPDMDDERRTAYLAACEWYRKSLVWGDASEANESD